MRLPAAGCFTALFLVAAIATGCGSTAAQHPDQADGGVNCISETEPELCTRSGWNCGEVTGTDNCGHSRRAACGNCGPGSTCSGGGKANVCGIGSTGADGGSPDAGPSVVCQGNRCTLQCAAGFVPCRRACQPVGTNCWSTTALPGTASPHSTFLRMSPDGTAHVAFDDWTSPETSVTYLTVKGSSVSPTEFVGRCTEGNFADVQLAGGKLEAACKYRGQLTIYSPQGSSFAQTFSHSLTASTSFSFGFARGLGLLHTTEGTYPNGTKTSVLLFPPAGVDATVVLEDQTSSVLPFYYLNTEAIVVSESPLTLAYVEPFGSVHASRWDPATQTWTKSPLLTGNDSLEELQERAGQVWGCHFPWNTNNGTGHVSCAHYESGTTWTWYSMTGLLTHRTLAFGLDSRGQLAVATVRTDASGAQLVELSYPVGSTVVTEPMLTIAANDWVALDGLAFDEHDEPVVLFTQQSGLALLR